MFRPCLLLAVFAASVFVTAQGINVKSKNTFTGKNGQQLSVVTHTYKDGAHAADHLEENAFKDIKRRHVQFDGFSVKSKVNPALKEIEKNEFVALSHGKRLKLTAEQKIHVDAKLLEEQTQAAGELKTRKKTHLLDHDEYPISRIDYPQHGEYVEYGMCGSGLQYTPYPMTSALQINECFLCEDDNTREEHGCKVTYDYVNHKLNFTSYNSLTCNDWYWWMESNTTTYPADECIYDYFQYNYLAYSNSYADPYGGGLTQTFYNTSDTYCYDAPFAYNKMGVAQNQCISSEMGDSFMYTDGCEYYYEYSDSHCSQVSSVYPTQSGMCHINDDSHGPVHNLPLFMAHSFPVSPSWERSAMFCGLGEVKEPQVQCMQDGTDYVDPMHCTRDVKYFDPYHALPSADARICKPDNDDELKVESALFALDNSTYPHTGIIRVTIKTPDDVKPSDRFRVVAKMFDVDFKKHHMASFKFNGRPENKTMTFQVEGPYNSENPPRMASIKIKERVYDFDRNFTRRSCVKFPFN